MQRRELVLLDADVRYGERFRAYAARRKSFPFPVTVFSGWERLREELPGRRIAAILAEERLWRGLDEAARTQLRAQGGTLFLLTGQEGEEGEQSIYKYQSAEEILRELLDGLGEKIPVSGEDGGTEFVGIYTPLGGPEREWCRDALAGILGERESVLCVSLEAVSGTDPPAEGETGLSDVLYRHRFSEDGTFSLGESVSAAESPAILPAVVNPEDLWDLDPSEAAGILCAAGAEGRWNTVIVSVENGRDPLPVLRLCRRILLPVRDDPLSRRSVGHFLEYLQRAGEEEMRQACREVVIPESGGEETAGSPARSSPLGRLLEREMGTWEVKRKN